MSRIFIDPDVLKQSDDVLQKTQQSLLASYKALHTIQRNPITLTKGMYMQIGRTMHHLDAVQNQMHRISQYIMETPLHYESANATMNTLAHQLSTIANRVISSLSISDSNTKTYEPSKWKSFFWQTTESEFDHFNLKDGLKNLLTDGASIGGTYGAAIAKASYRNNILKSKVGLDIAAGTMRISGRCHANWKKDGKFDPNLSASVGAEASLAHGKVFADYKNDYFGAGVDAKGSVGVVSAKAKAVINKKEVTIEGDVGAALAKGECSGKIKLFGITFTATLTGEVGSVGVGAKYSSTSNSIEFGGKVAFLFGGGFNFKVDY